MLDSWFIASARSNGEIVDFEAVGIGLGVLAVPGHAVDQLGGAQRAGGYRYLQFGGNFLVQIDAVHRLGHGEIVGVGLDQPPAAELGEEPHAVGQPREVDLPVFIERHRVRVVPAFAQAVGVVAKDARQDGCHLGVDIARRGDGLGHLGAVGIRGVDPAAGFEHCGHHRLGGVGVLFDELGGGAQNLLWMVRPDFLRSHRGEANLLIDGHRVPRLAYAEAVHAAHPHIRHHLRRRHGNHLVVLQRVDAVGRQPVIKPHRMRAGGEGLGEGVGALFREHGLGQRRAGGDAFLGQRIRQGDGLAVAVQAHEYGHVLLRPADAELHAIWQTVEHMRHLDAAGH